MFSPTTRAPTLYRWKPSTSLAGEIASSTVRLLNCRGSGTKMPCTERISIQLVNQFVHLFRRHICGELVPARGDAHVGARFHFLAHVDSGGRIVTHEYYGKTRCHASVSQRPDLVGEFVPYLLRDRVAVDDFGGQYSSGKWLTTIRRSASTISKRPCSSACAYRAVASKAPNG